MGCCHVCRPPGKFAILQASLSKTAHVHAIDKPNPTPQSQLHYSCCSPSGFTNTGCTCQSWDQWTGKPSYWNAANQLIIVKYVRVGMLFCSHACPHACLPPCPPARRPHTPTLLPTLPCRKSIVRAPKPLIFAMPPSSSIGGYAGATNPKGAPSSTSSTPTYVGCYADGAVQWNWPRTIPNLAPGPGGYTVTSCASYAYSQGASLIGLQNGGQCWYGSDMAAATAQGLCPNPTSDPTNYQASNCYNRFGSSGCTSANCGGECGGPYTNSIYTLL